MPHILFFLLILLPSLAYANDQVELYISNSPPIASPNSKNPGISIAPVITALESNKIKVIRREAPWPRAQKETASGINKLIAPLARTPSREANFIWIAPILETKNVIFTLQTPAENLSQAKPIYSRIGVGHGSAQADTLIEHGFDSKQVVFLKLGENPGRLLRLKRIDAWFTSSVEGEYIWHNLLHEPSPLKSSPTLSNTTLYLACSLDCDPILVDKLRKILTPFHEH